MSIVYIAGAIICVLWILRRLSVDNKITVRMGTLVLKLQQNVTLDAEGHPQTVLRIRFRGSLRLPESSTKAVAKIRIIDVTDSNDPLPVRSFLHGATDEHGMFYTEIHFDIPNGTYQFGNFDLLQFLLSGLHAPYQGARVFDVRVRFTDGLGGAAFSECQRFVDVQEDRRGYLELQRLFEQAEATERRMIDLFTSSDGTTNIEEIEACIVELHAFEIDALTEAVYQHCLEAASIMLQFTPAHRELLDHIAKRLLLPEDLVAELNDRHLRLSMMNGATDVDSIGMPSGLSIEQQLEFLAGEFRKWRARSTHADPAIAAEASARLEAIARARAALTPDRS